MEFKVLFSTRWNEMNQPLTIDSSKHKYTVLYRLGLNSLFVPNTNIFYILYILSYFIVTEQDMNNLAKTAEQQKNQRVDRKRNLEQIHDKKLAFTLVITKN